MRRRWTALLLALLAPLARGEDFSSLSLEELLKVSVLDQEVTSTSRGRQRVGDAPAAVYVLSGEEIRRSGMTSLPEALRMVPGMDVARTSASKWTISARGFNEIFSNKLLVMQDGRVLYQPLFSGVFWDAQSAVMQDIDRIEVVRGPGASLWGSNAVNGVINITTKTARETQGGLLATNLGTEEQSGALRYGGQIDEKTWYRISTQYRNTSDQAPLPGEPLGPHDGWEAQTAGFRLDHFASAEDLWTVQGDIYSLREGETIAYPVLRPPAWRRMGQAELDGDGGNALARWTHTISESSDFSIQLYYDRLDRIDPQYGYGIDTVDLDMQYRVSVGKSQEVVCGAGYRFMADRIRSSRLYTFERERRDDYKVSAFVQDRITIARERLYLFLGSKFEANGYSGLEVQPTARLLWTPDRRSALWGAVSRASRTPSRWEEDGSIIFDTGPNPLGFGNPAVIRSAGSAGQESEQLLAYEAGYRLQATSTAFVDVSAFYNTYYDLRSIAFGTPYAEAGGTPHSVFPMTVENRADGRTWGFEASADWRVTSDWRLVAGYAWIESRFDADIDSLTTYYYADSAPRNQVSVRSYLNITRDLELNAAAYYVENITSLFTRIPSYVRVDVNAVWRINKNLEWSAGVQNAMDPSHAEFGRIFFDEPSEMQRNFWTQLVWRF